MEYIRGSFLVDYLDVYDRCYLRGFVCLLKIIYELELIDIYG